MDSRNRLWIGTNDSGVFVMQQDELKQWNKSDGLESVSVRAVAEDSEGIIYIGTSLGLAMVDQDSELTAIRNERVEESTIWDLRRGSDGLVYGITSAGDVFTLRGGEFTSFLKNSDYPAEGVSCILPDPLNPGCIYFGAEGSQLYYGDLLNKGLSTAGVRSIDPLTDIQSIEYIDGQIWVCARNGMGYLDERSFHMLENVPMNNSVGHMMTDYEGNLWFTSTRQGVMKVVPNQFLDIFERYEIPAEVVNSTCLYGDQMFIGTDTGLIVLEDGRRAGSIPLTKAVTASGKDLRTDDLIKFLDDIRIRSIICDHLGRLWISTWRDRGLIRYDNGEITAFTQEDGMYSDRVRMVYECSDGTIVAASPDGISIIQEDSVTDRYGEAEGIKVTEILTAAQGRDGELIIGSDGGGIYIIKDGDLTHLGTDEGLKSEVVLRVKKSRFGDHYWVITGNSLAYMTPDHEITTIREFPYSNNFDIYENSRGDAWILSSDGIYVLPSDELLVNGKINPVHYGIGNGLPYVATANSYSELTDEGDLYIAGSLGIVKVNIEKSFEDVNDLKLAVPFLDADGTRIYPGADGSFSVPADTHKLTVNCFVYNYVLTDPQVSYCLEGFDQEYTTVRRSELDPVDYTNLKGGTYDFVIQLKDSMGRGNKETSIRIVKEKAFYEQAWFRALCAIALLMIIVLVMNLLLRRKTIIYQRREEEQKKLSRLFEETATALVSAIDAKDKYTHGHSSRVADYSRKLAEQLGKSEQECNEVYYAALLHDVGKIGIPREIINKNGRLTDEEYEVIKQHPELGAQILRSITEYPFLSIGANYHHERYDGRGYPEGLKGTDIPEIARIVSVADAYDAMTSRRSYRDPIPQQKVREELIKGSGSQFDPQIAKLMQHLIDLDTEYDMQEKEEARDLGGKDELVIQAHRDEVSEGIVITDCRVAIRFRVDPYDRSSELSPIPSIILFDSLDARYHCDERKVKDLLYYEYGELWFDGRAEMQGVRKTQTEVTEAADPEITASDEYRIEAVRIKDHIRIRMRSREKSADIIAAMPDSVRFSYIGLTGEKCRISNVVIDRAEEGSDPDCIPRIADEITYIDVPAGDIPNVQINGYRMDSTDGIIIKDRLKISFHMMSLPTARLVWHCAYIVLFTSDYGKIGGKNYKEFALIRPDGESWESEGLSKNDLELSKSDDFEGWEVWKEKNKEGYDITALVEKKGNTVTVRTENLGISIRSTTTIFGNEPRIYIALTGDQCAITNIRIEEDYGD